MVSAIKLVKKVMSLRHFNATDIARKLGISHSSVAGMLNRETLQIQRLVDLSHALKYNFFREIASTLDYDEPRIGKDIMQEQEAKHKQEVEQLKEEIKRLEIKVEVLEEVLEKVVGK